MVTRGGFESDHRGMRTRPSSPEKAYPSRTKADLESFHTHSDVSESDIFPIKWKYGKGENEDTKMLPRSIPPLTKEEFKEFQKEIQREPSKELVEALKRAKAVYESKAL